MTALLELPAVRQQVHLLSVRDYQALGEMGLLSKKVELLRGLIVRKMSKSPLHELVAQELLKQLFRLVPPGFEVRREGPLTLQDSEPEPDISVVCGTARDWSAAHPSTAELVIEVAVSSLAIDLEKADLYAEAGIPEYWLIRPQDRAADIFRQPSPTGYREKTTCSETGLLRCAALPGISVPLSTLLPARA